MIEINQEQGDFYIIFILFLYYIFNIIFIYPGQTRRKDQEKGSHWGRRIPARRG